MWSATTGCVIVCADTTGWVRVCALTTGWVIVWDGPVVVTAAIVDAVEVRADPVERAWFAIATFVDNEGASIPTFVDKACADRATFVSRVCAETAAAPDAVNDPVRLVFATPVLSCLAPTTNLSRKSGPGVLAVPSQRA